MKCNKKINTIRLEFNSKNNFFISQEEKKLVKWKKQIKLGTHYGVTVFIKSHT